jgi:glycosyltransferase involved in cell wall biosynthesis
MRSLVVTDSLIWTAETEYAVSVARAEARAGGDVSFASPGARFARFLPGVRALDLPGTAPSRSPADFALGARWLSELARRERFDVVHTARATAHVMAALSVGRTAPIVHLRGSASPPRAHAANRFLYRRLTAAVVASSARVRQAVIERLGVPPERMHRLLTPVDASVFRPSVPEPALARALGIPNGAKVVMNVARLAPIKGHDVLVRAMASVVARCPEAVLVLVGEPWSGQPAALRAAARRLGIEASVVLAGRRDDVPSLLALADVCVSSSVGSEENSRAVSEYMAGGRPVVATSVGVVPELVEEGVSGFLVPPGDAAALASALSSLLADPARARRMGDEGRRLAVERFSCEAFSRGLAEVLEGAGVVS